MEIYRMFGHLQQQGVPVLGSPQMPGFTFDNNPLLPPRGDGSVKEAIPHSGGFYGNRVVPAVPLKSDEADEAEEAEGGESPAGDPADDSTATDATLNDPVLSFL
ncbi:enamelin [Electrophorus electricus]|uniref:enamelin n=1 Tax=Electrophorus electricus TaxID=8005 RepID=UPI0015D083A1|nr:enamelin [Electrophorus electricus]